MGLDGISINQLRITQELNSSELNSSSLSNNNEVKPIDGLSNSQRVDPDKERGNNSNGNNQEFDEENQENEDIVQETAIKYDLSDSSKYVLKLDYDSNEILIKEKATNNIIQRINADELSKFVTFSYNSCGSIINKKF